MAGQRSESTQQARANATSRNSFNTAVKSLGRGSNEVLRNADIARYDYQDSKDTSAQTGYSPDDTSNSSIRKGTPDDAVNWSAKRSGN